MKKRFGVAAFALATGCAVIFAGCSGCNGCGANGKSNEAAFSSNWYADTKVGHIQPTFLGNEKAEVITYTVTHDKKTADNRSYSVDYADGAYTTTFYATEFDKDLIDEEFKGDYKDNLVVYRYETALDISSVTFTVGGKTSDPFTSSITTVSYFMDVDNHLQPLYSEQHVDTVTPTEYQVGKLEDAYIKIKQDIKTSYKYDGSAAKTVITGDNATEFVTDGLNDTDNSLIDVNGLNIAIRAMQLSASLSQVISVYSPSGKLQSFTFAGSAGALGEDERKGYEGILEGKELYVAGEGKSLNTVCVTATLNADMNGASQQYWFAAIDNAKNNTGRATMVKMSAPLPFSLGTLNYTLNGITNTLY